MKIWTPEFRSYLLVRVLNRRGSRVPRDVIDLSSDPVNWCPFGAKGRCDCRADELSYLGCLCCSWASCSPTGRVGGISC
eukprot:scaffold185416_cov16-Tisochrysis_lutea.AAC.2